MKADRSTRRPYETSQSYIVVNTGLWIFGKKVPAGVIQRTDLDSDTVFVDRTKDEIEDAPELDEASYRDAVYRSRVAVTTTVDDEGDKRGRLSVRETT